MKSLYDFEVLCSEVFYKCFNILDYVEKNLDMSDLDREAIQATIMDALVYSGCIDPNKCSLDLNNFCIVDNLEYYNYEKHPNVCGIPLWMKEKFRHKSLKITGGIPASLFLSKPQSKIVRYCVYDPNIAVSSIFDDATFYNVFYISPTRNVRIESYRPFVEVEIEGELYLVDTLTKRIFKSSYFKETYGFDIVSESTMSTFDNEGKNYYEEMISEHRALSMILPFFLPLMDVDAPCYAEMKYELLKTKENYPEEWIKYEEDKKLIKSGDFMKELLSKRK